jgi:hypothetical protein
MDEVVRVANKQSRAMQGAVTGTRASGLDLSYD